jgi:hypothetical protein
MTRRQISLRAFDPEHKKLMMAHRNARGGEKTRALEALRNYVTASLPKPRRRGRRIAAGVVSASLRSGRTAAIRSAQ